ncbi:M14 family metallopeptidase [Azospirillum sp. TSO35-2]|uniref:M14 family metallopeptidase n=1 Tax=Azospirillum sp. TSO35-2 TaxID=716796 RepID=UPI000D60A86B|nr:M14 family metallopeptidase [Azospirillum sp. TSO35-2]PWC39550.1 peptidase M14 [Azospirillum sp. TSO35-2]
MTVLFEAAFERTLDRLCTRLSGGSRSGHLVEAWTFDDARSRRACERRLKERGVSARLRSAYKPLLHFFLEEVERRDLTAVTVAYPVHPQAPANRFLLEAYPLGALLDGAEVAFHPRADGAFHYDVTLTFKDGRREEHRVAAPNRVHTDMAGETSVSPTGWLCLEPGGDGERLETEYERLFETAMTAVAGHPWTGGEPYFEELSIRVDFPAADEPLGFADEVVSLREALHEDFYFSLLEVFQRRSGRPLGDRGLKPGQIAPDIVRSDGPVRVRVELRPLSRSAIPGCEEPLDRASAPIGEAAIRAALERIGGEPFEADTRSGRRVLARHVRGSDAPVMISGGQHANETTGVVGALRAASRLAQRPGAHFTVSPLENPDGYALHHRLRADNPRHMHHAARYTALGDDLEYRNPAEAGADLNEKAIRLEAERRSGARLHLNLHGYPSHEWTRPLSGYVPRNFAMWTLPKGFFLVMRHHAGWETAAERLLDRVTAHLGTIPGLAARNAEQITLYETHAGETGFRVINGFPCLSSLDERSTVPVTMITEYPDETIYGDAFIQGHTAQMATVLAAYAAWQEIAAV